MTPTRNTDAKAGRTRKRRRKKPKPAAKPFNLTEAVAALSLDDLILIGCASPDSCLPRELKLHTEEEEADASQR